MMPQLLHYSSGLLLLKVLVTYLKIYKVYLTIIIGVFLYIKHKKAKLFPYFRNNFALIVTLINTYIC